MTERPILFSGSMVRALLAGTKTQTRRMLKPQPRGDVASLSHIGTFVKTGRALFAARDAARQPVNAFPIGDHSVKDDIACPYGAKGGHLWVRETFFHGAGVPIYRATDKADGYVKKWTPAIHMPRAACRMTLEITGVRVEQLQTISHDDACAEGIENTRGGKNACIDRYRVLWEAINGPGSWEKNPWVWVVSFKRAD